MSKKANPVTVNRMARLRTDMLREGLALFYRGDDVPYVQAKNLITKGKETGTYMLPAFIKNDAHPKGVEWMDIPGNTGDTYLIVSIETNRKMRLKSGAEKPLPDLIHIKGSGYEAHVTFALNPDDVCAKFGPLNEEAQQQAAADIEQMIKTGATELEKRLEWQKATQESGW